MVDQIIKTHLAISYPVQWKNVLSAETIDKIKGNYPYQIAYLKGISEKLQKGMTVKQIAYAIESLRSYLMF